MLNILAAFVETASTNWFSVSRPAWTPFVQTTESLSYKPLTPFGILLNWSFPILFWSVQNVQLSVPTTSMIPLWMDFIMWVFVVGSGLKQGDITYRAAISQFLSNSLVPSEPTVEAKVSLYTSKPLFRALITSSEAYFDITWTIYKGTLALSAIEITLWTASASTYYFLDK